MALPVTQKRDAKTQDMIAQYLQTHKPKEGPVMDIRGNRPKKATVNG